MVRIEEGVRRFHRDGFTFQRLCALLIVHKNRASVLVHRHIVNRFVLGFQRHVACGHLKGEFFAVLPAAIRLFGCSTGIRPLLELFCNIVAVGETNGHFGTRQIDAGVAVSVHDGAAGHGEIIQLLVISGQGHVACGHGEGKAFAGLPAIGQVCGFRAAERPLLELLCIRVRRGRNGHPFTGIEAGIDDVVCLGGDAFRQGKGVKGGGFDAEIRLTRIIFIIRVTCVMLFRFACRGGIINTAHARWRRIGDVLCRPAAGVLVDDFYIIGIFNGRTAGNDRCRSPASCYGHTGAAVDNQLALNRNAGFILNAYVSARRNGGLAFDSSSIVTLHSDGTTGGHNQPVAHRRAA